VGILRLSSQRSSYRAVVPAWRTAVGCILTLSVAACGSSPAPTAPAVPSEVTINVTATGFKPKDTELAVGGHARFENIDDRLHSIASNPLISHADCPPINEVGVLVPGQSKVTGALTEAKTCGYHDTASEGSGQLLMGTITVR
jgi:plastocyanin